MTVIKILLLLSIVMFSSLAAAANIEVNVIKQTRENWQFEYRLPIMADKLVFFSTSDNSREHRWQPVDTDFEMVYDVAAKRQWLSRRDGKRFDHVTFLIPPTYISLPKDYAPFSPFSDGGVAWYTGRFKVCINSCNDLSLSHRFVMTAPGDNIILFDQFANKQLGWNESYDSDQIVYVGPASTGQGSVRRLIDQQLPGVLRKQLDSHIPAATDYFASYLGKLDFKPMIIASYGKTGDGRYGYQGGTLGPQLFTHWYGDNLHKLVQQDEYFVPKSIFFFAHEVAHLFQNGVDIPEAAWIHEGMAEWMATDYLTIASVAPEYVEQRLKNAEQSCQSSSTSSIRRQYECGMWVMTEVSQKTHRMYEIWQTFVTKNENGQITEQDFWDSVAEYLPAREIDKIRRNFTAFMTEHPVTPQS